MPRTDITFGLTQIDSIFPFFMNEGYNWSTMLFYNAVKGANFPLRGTVYDTMISMQNLLLV